MICDEESETVREPFLIYGEESVDCKVYASTTYDFASDVTSYTRSHMASPQANVIINDEKRGRGPGAADRREGSIESRGQRGTSNMTSASATGRERRSCLEVQCWMPILNKQLLRVSITPTNPYTHSDPMQAGTSDLLRRLPSVYFSATQCKADYTHHSLDPVAFQLTSHVSFG